MHGAAQAMEDDRNKGVRMLRGATFEDIRQRAYCLCREYLDGAWRQITLQQFLLKKVSGGLSNLLYYCSLPDHIVPRVGEPSRVLLRIYGETHEERALETHLAECVTFTLLSEHHGGPRLYGIFPGGRLEQYIPARPLRTAELLDEVLSQLIADSIAQIHSMKVPISKEPKWLWSTMEGWLHRTEEYMRKENGRNMDMVNTIKSYTLDKELRWLREYLTSIGSPVLFCHNDLQGGNILLKDGSAEAGNPRLVIIDFEYCAYNYRGFDLANHFCETMYDYTNEDFPYFWEKRHNFPGRKQQEKFARQYLQRLNGTSEAADDEVETVLKEIKAYVLASHFFWALWSVVNATNTTITFDYWGYGKARFDAYFEHKTSILEDLLETRLTSEVEDALQIANPSALIETNS